MGESWEGGGDARFFVRVVRIVDDVVVVRHSEVDPLIEVAGEGGLGLVPPLVVIILPRGVFPAVRRLLQALLQPGVVGDQPGLHM